MNTKTIILSSIFILSSLSAENSFGLDINSNDVETSASLSLNSYLNSTEGTRYSLDGTYLHTDSDNLLSVGVSAQNELESIYGLTLGLGLKAVSTDSYLALPLVAKSSYILPLNDSLPTTSWDVNLAYAPSVLSFSDADGYFEFRTQLDMEVISNIHLFTGYRNIHTDYQTHKYKLNDSFYGGIKLSF